MYMEWLERRHRGLALVDPHKIYSDGISVVIFGVYIFGLWLATLTGVEVDHSGTFQSTFPLFPTTISLCHTHTHTASIHV